MREIKLTVHGDTVHASRHRAGIQGEANATALVVSFDESWDGYAKKITFWDALVQNPVERTLTVDLLVDAARDTRTYKTTIPGEPLTLAGECLLVIDGFVDGVHARSVPVRLTVEEAPTADNAGEPADPTPTQAEQLQMQIDTIMEDIGKAVAGAEAADTAAKAAAAAVEAANRAEWHTVHPAYIGENGNWFEWDGEKYVDSGRPSLGRSIASSRFNAQNGRWEIVYTDGSVASIDGLDPVDGTIWSIMRDDFERYAPGEDTFMEQAAADWRVSSSYPTENTRHDVAGDDSNKYMQIRNFSSDGQTRATMISQHLFQGEHTVEFDCMPTNPAAATPGSTQTDFLELRLFTTDEMHVFARVNLTGVNRVYSAPPDNPKVRKQSPIITDANGNYYICEPGVWYRVKV